MKPFWVYILRCADDAYYTGHTDNLELRISQHQAGAYDSYTATRRPVKLVWSQECVTREEALAAELQIKGWSRKKKEAMMCGDWGEVSRLARNKSSTTVRPEPVEGRFSVSPQTEGGESSPARSKSSTSVRPEPVEGRFSVSLQAEGGDSSPAHSKSVHASTSSARTDLLADDREHPQNPVRPEPVEGHEGNKGNEKE